jgi:hypothetical protein
LRLNDEAAQKRAQVREGYHDGMNALHLAMDIGRHVKGSLKHLRAMHQMQVITIRTKKLPENNEKL